MQIGEASKLTGVSAKMIRHYEAIGLIPKAARRDSGYRDYDQRDVHTLRFIARARDLGFPIEEIRSLLTLWLDRSRASGDVKMIALQRADQLKQKERDLREMRRTLEDLARACQGGSRPDCPILEELSKHDS